MRNTTKKSFASSRPTPPYRTKGEPPRKLTKEQKRDIRTIAAKRDEDIDFSDTPTVVDWSRAEIGKFYRPTKKPVTIRLDSDVIAWLKADGRGYQTKANWLLRQAMTHLTEGTRTASNQRRSRRPAKGK
ncbi:MAG TPA: BrnA antitoxin family protein [Verrucomicrobiae bacterium]|nr:BrnA antitoxin family protein [Verrucomicrobiae bacterium]